MSQIEVLQILNEHPEGIFYKDLRTSQILRMTRNKEIRYEKEIFTGNSGTRIRYRYFITEKGKEILKNYNPIIIS